MYTEVRASQDQVASLSTVEWEAHVRDFVHELQAAGSKRTPNGVRERPITTFVTAGPASRQTMTSRVFT